MEFMELSRVPLRGRGHGAHLFSACCPKCQVPPLEQGNIPINSDHFGDESFQSTTCTVINYQTRTNNNETQQNLTEHKVALMKNAEHSKENRIILDRNSI